MTLHVFFFHFIPSVCFFAQGADIEMLGAALEQIGDCEEANAGAAAAKAAELEARREQAMKILRENTAEANRQKAEKDKARYTL